MLYNEELWKKNVEQARGLVANKRHNQMRIAELALQVCEITWGGSGAKEGKTLTDFAKEVGIIAKTLSNWIGIKRGIYDKLSPELRNRAKMGDMNVAARHCGAHATVLEVNKSMGDLVYGSSVDTRILKYLQTLRSIHVNMQRETVVLSCKTETLEEIDFFCAAIRKAIKENSPNPVVPRNNFLCSVYSSASQGLSAADAMEISRVWKINPNDKTVLDYLKKHNRLLTPTYIGASVFKGINKNTAKLRALRSLTKLHEMGHVLKDTKGNYKIKNLRTA